MESKYGQSVRLWECHLYLKNEHNDRDGQFKKGSNIGFQYQYMKKSKCEKDGLREIYERLPKRLLLVDNPVSYNHKIN